MRSHARFLEAVNSLRDEFAFGMAGPPGPVPDERNDATLNECRKGAPLQRGLRPSPGEGPRQPGELSVQQFCAADKLPFEERLVRIPSSGAQGATPFTSTAVRARRRLRFHRKSLCRSHRFCERPSGEVSPWTWGGPRWPQCRAKRYHEFSRASFPEPFPVPDGFGDSTCKTS